LATIEKLTDLKMTNTKDDKKKHLKIVKHKVSKTKRNAVFSSEWKVKKTSDLLFWRQVLAGNLKENVRNFPTNQTKENKKHKILFFFFRISLKDSQCEDQGIQASLLDEPKHEYNSPPKQEIVRSQLFFSFEI
jgi:hypothetical protein